MCDGDFEFGAVVGAVGVLVGLIILLIVTGSITGQERHYDFVQMLEYQGIDVKTLSVEPTYIEITFSEFMEVANNTRTVYFTENNRRVFFVDNPESQYTMLGYELPMRR